MSPPLWQQVEFVHQRADLVGQGLPGQRIAIVDPETAQPCEACHGKRLNEKALAVKVGQGANATDIATPTQMSVVAAKDWFLALPDQLTDTQNQIAKADQGLLGEPVVCQIAQNMTEHHGRLTGQGEWRRRPS